MPETADNPKHSPLRALGIARQRALQEGQRASPPPLVRKKAKKNKQPKK